MRGVVSCDGGMTEVGRGRGFGWGSEIRFSWGTAKDMLDMKGVAANVQWPIEEEDDMSRLTDYFGADKEKGTDELASWFGSTAGINVF